MNNRNDHVEHATLNKFQYPESLVCEYSHWAVLARPKQVTLGSLVLVCKETAHAYSKISRRAFQEQEVIVAHIETSLKAFCAYEKINYLMLMMVDREVHFHVLPRYAGSKDFHGETYEDVGWPAAPDLTSGPELSGAPLAVLAEALRGVWPVQQVNPQTKA